MQWLAHALAVAAVMPLQLAAVIKVALLTLICLSLWRELNRRAPLLALYPGPRGELAAQLDDGRMQHLALSPDSMLTAQWIVLAWRDAAAPWWRRRQALVLPPDAMTAQQHRRLRIWLQWRSLAAAPA